jgi:RNA polymerase sigma factor (sigma-70 family)
VFDGKAVVLLIPLLPEKYESVILMRYLQGLSLKEIALLTKQSENTVAVQAHRGVAKLKKIYDEVHQ